MLRAPPSRAEADRRGVKPMSGKGHADLAMIVPQANTPYAADVRPFPSVLGAPCQQPPYGMLSAIDLASGRIVWSHPIGSAREAGPLGLHSHIPLDMGMPTVGGSIATRGGGAPRSRGAPRRRVRRWRRLRGTSGTRHRDRRRCRRASTPRG